MKMQMLLGAATNWAPNPFIKMNFYENFISGTGAFETIREEKMVQGGGEQKGKEIVPNIQILSQICLDSGIYSAAG